MSKKLILILMSVLAVALAQEIPAGAVQIDANTYRVDEKGPDGKVAKVYLYRRTPFGLSRIEMKPEAAAAADATQKATPAPPPDEYMKGVKLVDLGDSYRFERPGPFGLFAWTRKKTELNAAEKAFVAKQTAEKATVSPSGSPSASPSVSKKAAN